MIELPDFEKPFFYENNHYLTANVNRMSKVLTHYELFKKTIDIPGEIVECGVFKGMSLIRFATFRELLCNPNAKQIIGFDAFGEFPESDFLKDKKPRQKFINDSGEEGIGKDQLIEVLSKKGINKKIELIKGNLLETLPKYIEENPHLRISLLNIDVDVYEPTKCALDYLFSRVVKGGIIMLDDYSSVFPGANKAVEDFFIDKDYKIRKMPFAVTPCYIKK